MKLTLAFLMFTFIAFSQVDKRKIFFDASTSAVMPNFKAKANNDEHFNAYMINRDIAGLMKIGLGYQYPSNLTFSLKGSFAYLAFNLGRYYRDLGKSYPDSYLYTNEKSINKDSAFVFEYTFTAEIGYLMNLSKIAIKPNLELGFFHGTLRKNIYGYRSDTENLITVVNLTPRVLPSIYLQPSIDIGIRKWKRSFLHFGYGFTNQRVSVQTFEEFPDGSVSASTQINKYGYHRIIVGYKFAFLR